MIPTSGQTVHLMGWYDVYRVRRDMRRNEGRNVRELALYTTDDLRHLYQDNGDSLIRLRDGIVTRAQLVAEIEWRGLRERLLLALVVVAAVFSVVGGVASVVGAIEGWKR
jgi:hypothetical protein